MTSKVTGAVSVGASTPPSWGQGPVRIRGRRSISCVYVPYHGASLKSCWCASTICARFQEVPGSHSACSWASD